MIWTGYREESIAYRRVRWAPGRAGHLDELEDYGMFTGGSIELSSSSELGASGSLSFSGSALPDTSDLVRVYYRFADEEGGAYEEALGTFFAVLSDPTHDMGTVSGSVTLQSVLRVLKKGRCRMPYNVPRYTNAVERAADIAADAGIPTNGPAAPYRVGRGVCFDFGTNWLEVCNSLLSSAGFAPCRPDAMGGVVMAPRGSATQDAPVWTFEDGPLSIMKPEVVLANDAADTANAVHLRYEGEGRTLWASAYNDDPASPASRIARGYEVSVCEKVTELAGATWGEKLSALKEEARARLVRETAGTEYVEWEHPWVPLRPESPVGIEYRGSGLSWLGRVSNMRLSLGGDGLTVKTRAVSQADAGFRATVEGGAW